MLASLSSWFCVCAGWWWKLMSLCYIVESLMVQGSVLDERLSLDRDTQCMTCGHAVQQQEVAARGDCEAAAEYSAVLGGGFRETSRWWSK